MEYDHTRNENRYFVLVVAIALLCTASGALFYRVSRLEATINEDIGTVLYDMHNRLEALEGAPERRYEDEQGQDGYFLYPTAPTRQTLPIYQNS